MNHADLGAPELVVGAWRGYRIWRMAGDRLTGRRCSLEPSCALQTKPDRNGNEQEHEPGWDRPTECQAVRFVFLSEWPPSACGVGLHVSQIDGQIARRVIALLTVLLQCFRDDLDELRRHAFREP